MHSRFQSKSFVSHEGSVHCNQQPQGRPKAIAAAVLTALVGALSYGCSSGKPPAPAKRQPPVVPVASAQTTPAPIPVKQADVALLQKSVARVLGFTDIGGIALTIYQDSGSALYNNLAAQEATVEGVVGDPIFYHSPVFVADYPKLIALGDGRIEVTINNMFTQEAVRRAIDSDMSDVLAAYKIRLEKIGLIPVTDVTVNVNAFGKDYKDAELDEEFRTISFSLPSADIPQYILDLITDSQDQEEAGDKFLQNLSSINISYGYFVQQYGQQQCQLNIGSDDVRDMYLNQEGCPPSPSAEEITAGLAWVAAQKGESAADSVNSKLASIMSASSVVTACAAGNEARKLQGRAAVSCTKQGEEDFSPVVLDFLKSTIQPTLQSKTADMRDPKSWDDDLMAAVIQMFGSPERFVTEVNSINSEIQNKNISELDNDYYDKVSWMADTLRNYDVFNQTANYVDKQGRLITNDLNQVYNNQVDASSQPNSKGSGGGLNFSYGGFGVGGNTNSVSASGNSNFTNKTDYQQNHKATDEFKRDYNEFHNIARSMTLETDTRAEEAVRKTSEYLYNFGFDHSVEKVEGKFKIFPRLNIAVKASASRAESFAQNVQTNELGEIVLQKDNFPAQLVTKEDPRLVVRFKCDENSDSWTVVTKVLTQYRWWLDQKFWDDLTDRASERFLAGGCNFLAVKMWYREAAGNGGMVPKVLDLSVHGLIEETTLADDGSTEVFYTKSRPIAIELRRENTEQSPSDGSIQVRAEDEGASSGKTFTKLIIVQ